MFKCLICNKEFKSINGLSHHITKTEKISVKIITIVIFVLMILKVYVLYVEKKPLL